MPTAEGEWVRPTTDKTNLANVTSQPDHDVQVRVSPRTEYSDSKWVVDAWCHSGGFRVWRDGDEGCIAYYEGARDAPALVVRRTNFGASQNTSSFVVPEL